MFDAVIQQTSRRKIADVAAAESLEGKSVDAKGPQHHQNGALQAEKTLSHSPTSQQHRPPRFPDKSPNFRVIFQGLCRENLPECGRPQREWLVSRGRQEDATRGETGRFWAELRVVGR